MMSNGGSEPTAETLCELLAKHGPATAEDLAALLGLDLRPFPMGRRLNSCSTVARRIQGARQRGYPIRRRRLASNVFEYAHADEVERQAPVYDHGGWE